MKQSLVFALAVAMALVPAPAGAQHAGHAHGSAARAGTEPGYLFQRLRSELDLSASQVERLKAITARLEQQNRPLVEQLRAAGAWSGPHDRRAQGERRGDAGARPTPEQRAEARARMQERMQSLSPEEREAMRKRMATRMQREVPAELRPVLDRIRENSRSAMQEAREVLTAEQQSRLTQLVREHHRAGRPEGRRPGR